jgi:hypothetical protein
LKRPTFSDEIAIEACKRIIDGDSNGDLPAQSDMNAMFAFVDADALAIEASRSTVPGGAVRRIGSSEDPASPAMVRAIESRLVERTEEA